MGGGGKRVVIGKKGRNARLWRKERGMAEKGAFGKGMVKER